MPPKKIKQLDDDSDYDGDTKPKRTPAKRAPAVKKAAATADGDEPVKKGRVTKVFTKAGQKKDTPDELDGLRLFYESLLREKKDSEMAARWCIQHGIFDEPEHNKLVAKWGTGPGRAAAGAAAKGTAAPRSRGKKAAGDDDSDAEFAPKARAATTKATPKKSPARTIKKQRTKMGSDDDGNDDSSSAEGYTPKPTPRRGSSRAASTRRGKLESSSEEESSSSSSSEEDDRSSQKETPAETEAMKD